MRKTHYKTHIAENMRKNAIFSTFVLNVTIRREMGLDIDGACGQLRRKHLKPCK